MTTANMKLVILDVPLNDKMESPDQNLQDGEAIMSRTVEVKNLYRVLKGMLYSLAVQGPREFRSHHEPFPRAQEYEKRKVGFFLFYLFPSAYERIFSWGRIISSTRGCCTSLQAST
jgi:hypothetical protein